MTTQPRRTSALASFQATDWSEDLEASLKSFRSLREADDDGDNDDSGEGSEEAQAARNADAGFNGSGTLNSNDDDDASDEEADIDDDDDDDEGGEPGPGGIRVPDEFVCPLTLAVMRDPVVSKFGHSYERGAILSWLVEHRQTCPLTRRPLSLGGIITNHQLRGRIRRWQLEHEMDVTVLCSAADFGGGGGPFDSFSASSSSKYAHDAAVSRLGGFYIMPDLDDTERSTDDEADDDGGRNAATAEPRRRRAIRAGESASSNRRNGGRPTAAASRRAGASGGSSNNSNSGGSLRIVSGISRRFFGSRPAEA